MATALYKNLISAFNLYIISNIINKKLIAEVNKFFFLFQCSQFPYQKAMLLPHFLYSKGMAAICYGFCHQIYGIFFQCTVYATISYSHLVKILGPVVQN